MNSFSSNTIGAAANQTWFSLPRDTVRTGRVFFRIMVGGTYRYSLSFADTIDSTFADGSHSRAGMTLGGWTIHAANVARAAANTTDFTAIDTAFSPLTFDGEHEKTVAVGDVFSTDPVTLTFDKGDYLCLELVVSGDKLPCHAESVLPIYIQNDNTWVYDTALPLPFLVGCDRPVKRRIGFWGDSITQGIGTDINSYAHWNALIADKLGDENAYHNLGIGFGRASDAAAGGTWAAKAMENDVLFVCFGVNDLMQGADEQQLIADLTSIVDRLKAADKTVILQTIPPFDYAPAVAARWHAVNHHIQTVLCRKVDKVFDTVAVLGESEQAPHKARFGGHPNAEGCKRWAEALYKIL